MHPRGFRHLAAATAAAGLLATMSAVSATPVVLRNTMGATRPPAPASLASPVIKRNDTGGSGSDKLVFAHYMVGIASGNDDAKWAQDVSDARSASIDGFALNVGTNDYTAEQVSKAYAAAGDGGFGMFLSFDMDAADWSVDQVVQLLKQTMGQPGQVKVGGKALVSTFVGSKWGQWDAVRDQVGGDGIYLVPDWHDKPATDVVKDGSIDGAFDWNAWPGPGSSKMDNLDDATYLGLQEQGKSYMMGVSPGFYTNLPEYNKNWWSSSETLWFDRWQQIIEKQPSLVEIITWNDYGESSYINEPTDAQIVQGADYAKGYDHSAFRFVLPYFIQAYKAGSADGVQVTDGAMAWYRTTPASIEGGCSNGETTWGQNGGQMASEGAKDVISVIALSGSGSPQISVKIGGQEVDAGEPVASFGAATLYNVKIQGEGAVSVSVNGKSTPDGPEISSACPQSGKINFNTVSIQTK